MFSPQFQGPDNKLSSQWVLRQILLPNTNLLRPYVLCLLENWSSKWVRYPNCLQHSKRKNSSHDVRRDNEQLTSVYRKTLSRKGRTSDLLSWPLTRAKLNHGCLKDISITQHSMTSKIVLKNPGGCLSLCLPRKQKVTKSDTSIFLCQPDGSHKDSRTSTTLVASFLLPLRKAF